MLESLVSTVQVATSNDGGHPPEFWAQRAAERIVYVSEDAPPVIKDQAIAFRRQIESVILRAIKDAIRSDRSTLAMQLDKAGESKLGDVLRRM